jgi:hypothetical protein
MVKRQLDSKVDVECMHCNKTYTINVVGKDLEAYRKGGAVIGEVLHYLSDFERELLISRTCEVCWDKFHESAEEEDDFDEDYVEDVSDDEDD